MSEYIKGAYPQRYDLPFLHGDCDWLSHHFSDHQVFFYIIPSLDPVPPSVIRPIRNVISLAVDEQHMRLPPSSEPYAQIEPIEFCVIKRTNIAMYSLKERLVLQQSRH